MNTEWIPVRKNLLHSREVLVIARKCHIELDTVVGRLIRFWAWVDTESESGEIPGVDLETLAHALTLPPDFLEALVAVGWLEPHSDGLRIPHWERWFGRSAKNRLKAKDRMATSRHPGEENVAPAAQQKANRMRTNVAPAAQQKANHITKHNITETNIDDVVERGGRGGENQPPPVPVQVGQNRGSRPQNVPIEPGQNRDTGPPPAVGPEADSHPAKVERAFRACERLWPGGRIAKRRDRLLVWRLAVLAAGGETWARVVLESLWDAKPAKPGAYLQRLILELGPRQPENVAILLEKIPVPPEIVTPVNGRAPPAQGAKAAAGTPDPEPEKALSPEEDRAMVREVIAVIRANGKGSVGANACGKGQTHGQMP